jgi:hypothetical protein
MTRLTAVAGALFLVVAAACSSTEASGVASLDDTTITTDAPGAESAVDVEEAVLAFTACLRDEGLEVEDPTFDGTGGFGFNLGQVFRGGAGNGDGPNEEFQGAFEECQVHLEGVAQQFERPDQSELEDGLLAFAECMRGEGVDVADPDFSDAVGAPGGGPRRIFGDLDPDDPTTAAAFELCQSELAFGPRGGPGGGAGQNNGGNA